MNDSERIKNQDYVHLLIAIRRKKENREMTEYCIRRVIRDEEQDLKELELIVSNIPGIWRIYHTCNLRDVDEAARQTISSLILHPENNSRIDSIWKTNLMRPVCKAEKNYLIDIDTDRESTYLSTKQLLIDNGVEIQKDIKTPNGWHIVTGHFDTRIVQDLENVELHRDRYYFIKIIGGDE